MKWKKVNLSDISTIIMGQSPSSDSYNENGNGLPFFQGKAEFGKINPIPVKWCSKPKKVAEKHDILLSVRAPVGSTNIADTTCCIGRGLAAIRCKSDQSFHKYIYWFLNLFEVSLSAQGKGSTFKAINKKTIENIQVPLPPLEEQKRIAEILDRADAIRQKRERAIALTEELARSTFLEMFGDPVINPKGWEIVTLNQISEVQGGLQVNKKRQNNPIEIPYLRVANVYRNKFILNDIKYIKVTQKELEKTKLQKGDLLIVEGHGTREEIGRSAVWNGDIENCTHQNHLIRVRIDPSKAEPNYVSAFLNSYGGRLQLIKSSKTTSGLNTISTSDVKSTKILLPPLNLQYEYFRVIQKVSRIINLHEQYLEESENFFNSLLQRAFKGEL